MSGTFDELYVSVETTISIESVAAMDGAKANATSDNPKFATMMQNMYVQNVNNKNKW